MATEVLEGESQPNAFVPAHQEAPRVWALGGKGAWDRVGQVGSAGQLSARASELRSLHLL